MTVEYSGWFIAFLKRLGDTLAPLALLSVVLQLQLGNVAENSERSCYWSVVLAACCAAFDIAAVCSTVGHKRAYYASNDI